MDQFLLQLFIFFVASAIAVPIARKIGLGSVLGYLIAGIVIGPFGLSLISDVESVMHFTEFGVVMMLFLVGLELKPSMLWGMRIPILGRITSYNVCYTKLLRDKKRRGLDLEDSIHQVGEGLDEKERSFMDRLRTAVCGGGEPIPGRS